MVKAFHAVVLMRTSLGSRYYAIEQLLGTLCRADYQWRAAAPAQALGIV